ncbi:DUF4262 domain-containing protein [Mycolicibacterium sp.]|uniref:DUF4262 domain-containing protein n=1 Tax=Mycolicibacterium sp. TaxID=2320850 RepID=UPI0009FA4CD1
MAAVSRNECLCIVCVDYGNRDRYDDSDRKLIADVHRYGHHCVGIGPTTPDEPPPYAFTAGLWHTHRQPELAIYGVGEFDLMAAVLNQIVDRAQACGHRLAPHDRFSGVMGLRDVDADDYWVKLMPIHPSWHQSQFGISLFFNGVNTVDFLQVVWPDGAGRYPGEPGFDAYFADRQPLIWLPVADHPPSVWVRDDMRSVDDAILNTDKGFRKVGAWGTGPFDNDTAGDWANDFDDIAPGARLAFLERTFEQVRGADVLDNRECEEVVAAAAVVAALMPGGPVIDTSMGPESLENDQEFEVSEDLRILAVAALREVARPDSEWAQLWAESGCEPEVQSVVTQLITDLEPYGDWAPFRTLEEALPAHLRDAAVALEVLRGVVEFEAVQAFTVERFVRQRDWGRALYQEVAVIDGDRLILWMGDDVRAEETGLPLFESELRVIPLSWLYDVSLDEHYRTEAGRRVLHSVELRLYVGINDYAKRIRGSKKTELYPEQLTFTKSEGDGGSEQMVRLIEFGRTASKLVR